MSYVTSGFDSKHKLLLVSVSTIIAQWQKKRSKITSLMKHGVGGWDERFERTLSVSLNGIDARLEKPIVINENGFSERAGASQHHSD